MSYPSPKDHGTGGREQGVRDTHREIRHRGEERTHTKETLRNLKFQPLSSHGGWYESKTNHCRWSLQLVAKYLLWRGNMQRKTQDIQILGKLRQGNTNKAKAYRLHSCVSSFTENCKKHEHKPWEQPPCIPKKWDDLRTRALKFSS